jgi:hypothetical protein
MRVKGRHRYTISSNFLPWQNNVMSETLSKCTFYDGQIDIFEISVKIQIFYSVADPDPGSGSFLTPGSGIRNRFFTDPGSRIPDPKSIFLRAY